MNVLSEYQKLQNKKILINKYINHGDISRDNIIVTKKNTYLIDFDEVCISSELYDFSVVIVKFCTKKSKINIKKYNLIKEEIKKYFPKYTEQDYIIIIKYYLCKILLEKFYLHQTGKINLFSRRQKIDNYEKYYILLNTL